MIRNKEILHHHCYLIRRMKVQANHKGLKFKVTYQLPVYGVDVNSFDKNIYTIGKNT